MTTNPFADFALDAPHVQTTPATTATTSDPLPKASVPLRPPLTSTESVGAVTESTEWWKSYRVARGDTRPVLDEFAYRPSKK